MFAAVTSFEIISDNYDDVNDVLDLKSLLKMHLDVVPSDCKRDH